MNMLEGSSSVVVLAGGVGAARFLRGLAQVHSPQQTIALVNTGDDTVLHGLNISPDIDTVIYTLSEAIDQQRGWGLADETWRAMASLKRYVDVRPAGSVAAPEWFSLGDQDLATHFYRTARRGEGADASLITQEIATAWKVAQRIVPMTNSDVATLVELSQDCPAGKAGTQISFQEYFVKHQHSVAVKSVHFQGAENAKPNCINELQQSEIIVIAPSNPIVSIGPIRALAGINDLLSTNRNKVVAISPIVGGRALKGPADRMLTELGHESSALGVARLYATIASTIIIDTVDADLKDAIESEGLRCVVTNTVMSTQVVAGELAKTTLASISGQQK